MSVAAPSSRVALNPRTPPAPGNVVLRSGTSGDYHVAAYTTPLSLKTVTRGVSHYSTTRTRYRIDRSSLVVLNAGQTYGMEIDRADRTNTLCVFFEPGFVEGVARAMTNPRAALDPELDAAPAFEMSERVHVKEGRLAAHLDALERRIARGAADEATLVDALFAIAGELVVVDSRARRADDDTAFAGAVRASTRQELARRLHWARDYLDASFAERLTVAELARVACMSPFHFQRLFKATFGETPMRRVQRRRLERAAEMLVASDASITAICFAVGLESPSTFSGLFARAYGAPPRAYREMRRIEEARRSRRP